MFTVPINLVWLVAGSCLALLVVAVAGVVYRLYQLDAKPDDEVPVIVVPPWAYQPHYADAPVLTPFETPASDQVWPSKQERKNPVKRSCTGCFVMILKFSNQWVEHVKLKIFVSLNNFHRSIFKKLRAI